MVCGLIRCMIPLGLALCPGTLALRESISLEEADQAGTVQDATREATGWLQMGTHVCCARVVEDKRGETTISFDVYHESATKEIHKCTETMITGIACETAHDCLKECKETMNTDYLFLSKTKHIVDKKFNQQIAAIKEQGGFSEADHQKELQDLQSAYHQELEGHRTTVNDAEQALETANADYAASEHTLEELKQAMEIDQEEIHALEEKVASSREAYQNANATALEKYEEGLRSLEEKLNMKSEESKQKLEEILTQQAAYHESVDLAKKQTVPSQCLDKAGKIRECCCVISGVPMKVPTSFNHWDECLMPQPFSKTTIWSLEFCKPFQECSKCREITCGKTMCPHKIREEKKEGKNDEGGDEADAA